MFCRELTPAEHRELCRHREHQEKPGLRGDAAPRARQKVGCFTLFQEGSVILLFEAFLKKLSKLADVCCSVLLEVCGSLI